MRCLYCTLFLFFTIAAFPQCQSANEHGVTSGHSIQLINVGGDIPASAVESAMDAWNSHCGGYASIPTLTTDQASIVVFLQVLSERPQGQSVSLNALAMHTPDTSDPGAEYTGGNITIFTHARDPEGRMRPIPTSLYDEILRHELGHALGLADVNGECFSVMNQGSFNGSSWTFQGITESDCQKLLERWELDRDQNPDITDCGPGEKKVFTAEDCNSPLIIDMARDNFAFSGPEGAVSFDLYGVGQPVHIQWVLEGTDDAFLVHDLNGNGLADDGSELFGSGTRLVMEGGALAFDGYEGLAQWDDPLLGGNGDGSITTADHSFDFLWLWRDANADGVATVDEMTRLEDSGMVRIPLEAKENRRRDRHGNRLRYWSWVQTENPPPFHKRKMVDVFFKQVD